MGVRSAAGLDGRDLLRGPDVADVEDPHAAEALGVHSAVGTRCTAVDPAVVLLDRHEQQIAVNRHIALPARADDRGQQLGLPSPADVIDVEAVEVTDEQLAVRDGHVAVGQRQRAVTRRVGAVCGGLFTRRRRSEDGVRVEEARRRRQRVLQREARAGRSRVIDAGCQFGAFVGRDGLDLGRGDGCPQQDGHGGNG